MMRASTRAFRWLALLLTVALVFCLAAPAGAKQKTITVNAADHPVTEDGSYSAMEEVAVYLTAYGRLPENFITKRQAEALGWNNREGNLEQVAPGCSIGGNHFGNYEKAVPEAKGRKWTECDINFDGGYRGGERIVFSNDGLIYYSDDHYATFRQVTVESGAPSNAAKSDANASALDGVQVKKKGEYTSMEEVAVYLHTYGTLPDNYLTKKQAKKLGFVNKKDNLGQVAPGSAIGGDGFGNREGLLPEQAGRKWHECDVNTVDGRRGAERLVYSNDGLIYYTDDGYKSYTRLY